MDDDHVHTAHIDIDRFERLAAACKPAVCAVQSIQLVAISSGGPPLDFPPLADH
jgi:hypothetical protein